MHPAYVNIFMASLKLKFVYPYIKQKGKTLLRFFDDLLMIWTSPEEEVLKFINECNKKHRTITLDLKCSKTKIEFLDVLLYKDNNKLQKRLYKNSINHQSCLHSNSKQYSSLRESRAYSQVLYNKRICSANSEFETHTMTLKNQFIKLGNEKTEVEKLDPED